MWVRSHLLPPENVGWVFRDDAARRYRSVAVVSGGGCVAVATFWLRAPGLDEHEFGDLLGDEAENGGFWADHVPSPSRPDTFLSRWRNSWYRWGFGWRRGRLTFPEYAYGDCMIGWPYWVPAMATAIPPILNLLANGRNGRRKRRGLCVRCGYDLREPTDRCPECGRERGAGEVLSRTP
jgi:hypothetical protein